MKKVITFLTILSMVGLLFAAEGYSKKEQGTYIPLAMYETLNSVKSYGEAIEATAKNDIYTVLCVTENEILSNIKFHDAFRLKDADIDFQFSSKNIVDKKTGEKYIKISGSTDYYGAYNDFLLKTVVKNLAKKNPSIKVKKSLITFDGEVWEIDKDQWHYSDNLQIILYCKSSNKYVGFSDNKAYTLKDSGDLKKSLDKEISF